MKRKVSKLRLSPNEEARIIREEQERRRKLRIQQVREQQRHISLQICREVEQRRQRELQQLEQELRDDWRRQQNDKLQKLQRLYQESLQLVGQSHRSAKENEPDLAAVAQREEKNRAKAQERYREALNELKTQKIKDHERQNQAIDARKKALQAEKERSAKVASLPPPPPNPIQNIDVKKPHVVKRCDLSAFATTYYHMLESIVEREAETVQPDARREAELETRRLQQLQEEEERRREERLEKAQVRGRQALRREQVVQDRERFLVELEHLQQMDLLRRRRQVSQMPPQISQSLYKRQETRDNFQREMEFAFEDMYTGERRVKGDPVVQLVPEPFPASSQDKELDVTVDETSPPEEHVQTDTEREAGSTQQETSVEAEPSRPAPRRALRKLLDRIRNQRNERISSSSSSSHVSDSPTVFTSQIPERDTSIESGSLQSEEKHEQTPVDVPEPTVPPPASLDLRDQTESSLPDVLVSKIQEFEEERKKREEELETEKRQQLFLLQELEEQKAKLEEMLLEAQQEREHLRAAVTREMILNQPQEPVQKQEVALEPAPPAAEDEHTRRIREYQQKLLEQNRVHQRSVEVARQRLEEYQRALRIRHNMTTRSLLSVARPPTVIHTQPDRLPAPPQPLAAPAGPFLQNQPQTRDSEASASPPSPASSSRFGAKMLRYGSVRSQRPDVNAQLTDDIMKQVTEHLPERLRPSFEEQLPHKLSSKHESTSSQLISDQLRDVCPSVDPDLVSMEEDIQRQRQRLQEAQRRVKEQREAAKQQQQREVAKQQQQREAVAALQQQREAAKQQREATAVMLQQREAAAQQQREVLMLQQQKEAAAMQRQRNEELEQMRRQKEALQALIDTDEQHVSPASCEELEARDVGQQRVKLLVSLLKAIEESNGGTLSHLEEPEENDDSLQQTQSDSAGTVPAAQSSGPAGPPPSSVLWSGLFHPPRALKPPVTRVKLGFKEMSEQHELSAIQEVETPVNTSRITGQEGYTIESSHTADLHLHESESFVSSDETQTSETSGHLLWRERLLSGAGTSPEQAGSESILKKNSSLSSDSGRGADFSGPGNTSCKSPPEPSESDCFSTTISSGSYVTTDPEPNSNTDKSLSFKEESGADLSDTSSPCGRTLSEEDNSASVFNDSNIQRIIDKYTRELHVSLSSAGTTGMTEDENSAGGRSVLSRTAAAQRSVPDLDDAVHPDLEHFTGEDPSLSDQNSFRPLTGHLSDQSSCLAADQREPVLEQLVGQPSARSSMIGPLPGSPVAGWDSTLSRMIGRLSHQSGSHWLNPDGGQLVGQMTLEPSWLNGSLEESLMRPLVGELDESEQRSGSSGESRRVAFGDQTSSSHSTPVAGVAPRLQDPTSPVDSDSHLVEESSDLFRPLEAEITHNETADPSMTFHLPERPLGINTPSAGSEPSPEQLRTEEPSRCRPSPSLQESFCQLVVADPQESVLTVSPSLKMDVEENSHVPSHLTTCCDTPAQRTSRSGTISEHGAGENQDFLPASDEIKEAAGEEGILEQSEITLVSLTDTTVTEETVQEDKQTEELVSTSLPKETPEDDGRPDSGTLLEFQWGPGKDSQDVYQQKRTALLQRSNRRVEEMKTKGARAKTLPQSQDPVKGTEPGGAEPVDRTAKTTSEPQQKKSQAKGGQKPPPLPSSARGSNLKPADEVTICTPEQRKRNLSEMHQRTQRLYEQLEEVKQLRATRTRQEDYATNRLKAKEFHKKTLQKLRAKKTR